MGIISVERADCLFWLGRYTERVFTTVKGFFKYYDSMIDSNDDAYKIFCEKIAIPDIYQGREDFIVCYVIDEENPDSILSNLLRAYDNAVISRDDVSTEAMAYLELALQVMKEAKDASAPVFELQSLVDYLYAFWGSIDDCIEDEEARNIVKCGRYVERMDLYLRLDFNYQRVLKEFKKFANRLERVRIGYNNVKFEEVQGLMVQDEKFEENRAQILMDVQRIFS